jgi:hypothetical protein
MSVEKPRPKNTFWHIEVERAEAVYARKEAALAPFNRHKAALLAHLRKAYERGPKSEPFDEEKSWHDLTRLAEWYFWLEEMIQETMPAAGRIKKLRELATILGRARGMLHKAMQDDVGTDLFKALFEGPGEPLSSVHRIANEMENVVDSLAPLETAARRAMDKVRAKRGRPAGTSVLPSDFVIALAHMYRKSTGRKRGKGNGPFARSQAEWV